MESKLQQIAKEESSMKRTENGAFAYNTTNNSLVDLFAVIGALRPRTESEIRDKFANAFNQDALLATKMLFYAGNIRGGLGERRTFRICLEWLANNYPSIVEKNIGAIPLFNRWDSIFVLIGTPCESYMWKFVYEQIVEDWNNYKNKKSISLLAKWMPSENASSICTKRNAKIARQNFNLTSRQYRKMLSTLRKYLDVTEVKMSSGNWSGINYEAVPSCAMMKYNNAFKKHDMDGFCRYIEALNRGEKKINASTLYPYDLVKNYMRYNIAQKSEVVEQQWKALPNYIDEESNILIMADVSGSMYGRPLETSIGLAIYFAERNKGPLEGIYMTFTSHPRFQYIDASETLERKVEKVRNTDIGYSTNLSRAFDYLLEKAVDYDFKQKDMPNAIVVISDMEIDHYMRPSSNWDFIKTQKAKYAAYGYTLPKMILWNVEARNDTVLSKSDDVLFVSGQSPSTFKSLLGNLNGKNNWDLMLEVLNNEIYDCITI